MRFRPKSGAGGLFGVPGDMGFYSSTVNGSHRVLVIFVRRGIVLIDTGKGQLGEVFEVCNATLVLNEFLVVLQFLELDAINKILL